ncbi:glycosyltransferase [Chryseobacterium sp. WG23]|uniref:glycosyltransferase n=1 Tax=Chryseobacterium sp. WG23 TaxID=2926910 RepID=UPI00211DF9A4|nr:glycosyltransferase [Chryseobacterium sp. WG23]MCQ9637253.1 glycosyltransferase [Chryseobacterium sp. WG23]
MAILEQDIIFGIVLYNEDIQTSKTYISLVKSIRMISPTYIPATILIFDNTPRVENQKTIEVVSFDDFIKVHYFTENKNRGLPYAYNFFAQKAKEMNKKWIVLLDQDTTLPICFYENYLNIDASIQVHCPLVFTNNKLMSPSYYCNFRSYPMSVPDKNIIELKKISCINSGLMINLDFFLKVGGYNPDLFLDFCDHDFIHKLKELKINSLGIIRCKLDQDFSAINHTKEQALLRYKLFVKDLKTFYKGKNNFQIFSYVDLPRLLKLTYRYKSLEFFKIRFI